MQWQGIGTVVNVRNIPSEFETLNVEVMLIEICQHFLLEDGPFSQVCCIDSYFV